MAANFLAPIFTGGALAAQVRHRDGRAAGRAGAVRSDRAARVQRGREHARQRTAARRPAGVPRGGAGAGHRGAAPRPRCDTTSARRICSTCCSCRRGSSTRSFELIGVRNDRLANRVALHLALGGGFAPPAAPLTEWSRIMALVAFSTSRSGSQRRPAAVRAPGGQAVVVLQLAPGRRGRGRRSARARGDRRDVRRRRVHAHRLRRRRSRRRSCGRGRRRRTPPCSDEDLASMPWLVQRLARNAVVAVTPTAQTCPMPRRWTARTPRAPASRRGSRCRWSSARGSSTG